MIATQTELFDKPVVSTRSHVANSNCKDWGAIVLHSLSEKAQNDWVTASQKDETLTYRSGASALSDLKGFVRANTPIGVCVLDTSKAVRRLVGEYSSNGGKCFIDSGAFRVFMQKLRVPGTPDVNFEKVFGFYKEIIANCSKPYNLAMVAPDVVGDQHNSFAVLLRHRDAVSQLIATGAKVIVPLQRGTESLTEYYLKCVSLFGDDLVVGLPSNAEALSEQEILGFISESQPKGVHFLGCADRQICHKVKYLSPATEVTTDASTLRKHIGEGRALTDLHRQLTDHEVMSALHGDHTVSFAPAPQSWDLTELLIELPEYIAGLSRTDVARLAAAVHTSPDKLLATTDNEEVWELLEENCFGYAVETVSMFIKQQCKRFISPKARTEVVFKLAECGMI